MTQAAEILHKHTPYEVLQFQTWVEKGILAAMKEIAELSLNNGVAIGHSATYYNSGVMDIDSEDVAAEKEQFLKQLFEETEK